ncbi:MAG TPA: hypothetical protein VK203_22575 [Nostocaceae cyanobacterium]|nr:hypothetical protein [Nostocaceae cyanobacterium]
MSKLTLDHLAPVTETDINELVSLWYKKLDIHAPMVEILPLLADQDLEMVFPETTAHGYPGFESWYQRVIRVFFDEIHTVKEVTSTPGNKTTEVKIVVQWQASMWNPPNPNSDRINCDAYQTWVIQRSPVSGKPIIVKYVVDKLEYHAGSARL